MFSIKTFRLDRKKSGELLKSAFHGEYGVRKVYREVADETDIPLDTVSNCLQAKNDISLERLIKFCLVSNMPLGEYLKRMFDGVDVDFSDKLHLILPDRQPAQPVQDTARTEKSTKEQKEAYEKGVLDMYERQLERFKNVHEGYRNTLVQQHVGESAHLSERCDAALREQEKHLKSALSGRNFWRTLACISIAIAIAILIYFVWEILNPTKGITSVIYALMGGF